MAVLDEIDVADLIDLDGRQAGHAVHGSIHAAPAQLADRLARQELAREIAVAAHAADDLVQGNALGLATLDLLPGAQRGLHLFERQQLRRPPAHHAEDAVPEQLAFGVLKTLARIVYGKRCVFTHESSLAQVRGAV